MRFLTCVSWAAMLVLVGCSVNPDNSTSRPKQKVPKPNFEINDVDSRKQAPIVDSFKSDTQTIRLKNVKQ